MNAFYFLNYVIYEWYRKRDKDPLIFAFAAPIVLLGFNLFSIFYFISQVFDIKLPEKKMVYFIPILLLIIISYLTLYRDSYYKTVFSHYDKKRDIYKPKRKYVSLYIIITIIFLLGTLVYSDIKFDGHL